MPQQWVEVNIVPAAPDQPERLLVGVIDGLVHSTFADRLDGVVLRVVPGAAGASSSAPAAVA